MTKEDLPNDEEMPSDDEDSTGASDEVPKEDDPSDNYFKLLEKEKDRIGAEMGLAKLIAVGAGLLGFGPIVYAFQKHLQTPYRFDLVDFGTFVGGTSGPLWSLAALAALYLGFLAQRRDSEQQREAFEKQQQTQMERFEREQFENTFFRLLDAYEEVSESLELSTISGSYPILYIVETSIETNSIVLKAKKDLGTDKFDVLYSSHDPDVVKCIQRDGKYIYPKDLKGVDLSSKEKRKIVGQEMDWLFNEAWNDVRDFLNVLMLIIDLFERTDKDHVPVGRYHMLMESKMRNIDRRLVYWITYEDRSGYIINKLQKYDLGDIEMPSDFTSLDKTYI